MKKKIKSPQPNEFDRDTDNDLPEGWESSRIGKLYSLIGGGTPSTKNTDFWDGSIPWISSADIHGLKDIRPRRCVSDEAIRNSATNLVPAGTVIVVTRVGLGKVALTDVPMCFSQDSQGLIPRDKRIDSEYALYFLSGAVKSLKNESRGTTITGVTKEQICDLLIQYPPLDEQRRIVAKVEALLARRKAAAEHLARAKQLLKAFRQSVLAAACAEGDVVRLGDILEGIKYGTAVKCDYNTSGIPVLRIPNVVNGRIGIADLKYAVLPKKEYESLRLGIGDILLVRSNGSASLLGKTAVVTKTEEGFAYAGYLMRLRFDQARTLPDFIHLALSTYSSRIQIEVPSRSTSGVHNINSDEVRNLEIALPAIGKQKEILAFTRNQFALADTIERSIDAATIRVGYLSNAVLSMAFRGELVPTEVELARAPGRTGSVSPSVAAGEVSPEELDALFYPHAAGDYAVRSIVCAVVEQSPGLSSMEYLDAVLLATHPRCCRAFLAPAEQRAFDKARKAAPPTLFLPDGESVQWQKCRRHLEDGGYLRVDHFAAGQPITRGTASTALFNPAVAVVGDMARYALMAMARLQQARQTPARAPKTHRDAIAELARLVGVA